MTLFKYSTSVLNTCLIVFTATSQPQLQALRFHHITAEDGLSNNTVNCILQDRQGFLWFGTNDGLNRHDGHTFRVFRNDPNDSSSLSNDVVSCLTQDSSGQLWVGTARGLNKYSPATEAFTQYVLREDDPESISNSDINAIYQDSIGRLWVGTEYGLNLYNHTTDNFKRFFFEGAVEPTKLHWNNNRINVIAEDHAGLLLVGTTDDFFRYDPVTGKTIVIPDYTGRTSDWWPVMSCICKDHTGKYWIGLLLEGVAVFDSETGRSHLYAHNRRDPHSFSADFSQSIYEDRSGFVWIASNDGLNIFDRTTERFSVVKHSKRDERSISSNDINCIQGDNQGNIWIGTSAGIDRLSKWEKPFRQYVHDDADSSSLAKGDVESICEDREGNIWTGSYGGGISKFNPVDGQFAHYRLKPAHFLQGDFSMVWGICEDRFGFIWSSYIEVNRLDKRTGKFKHYTHLPLDPKSHSDTWTPIIYEDRKGTLWFGTLGAGLEKFHRDTETFTHYRFDPHNPHSLSSNDVHAIYQDDAGVLWIGTGIGLCKMVRDDNGNEQFIRYLSDPSNSRSLSGTIVYAVFEDTGGRLWIGTDGGLNQMDRARGTFTVWTEAHGLPTNDIYGILEDDHGNLWLRTKRGLVKCNPESHVFRTYDEQDGLVHAKSIFIGSQAFCRSTTGEMYYGGVNSMTVFHPDSLRDNPDVPRVVITGLRLFNTPVAVGPDSPLTKAISVTTVIYLSHNQNNITIEFAALDFTSPGKNQHAYMMEGVDRNWVYCGNQHAATYPNLGPGDYTFRVRGSNNDGIWNETGTSIAIVVAPPWWKSTWAYLLYGAAIASTLYVAHRTRLNRQRLKHQLQLEHMEAEKLKEVDQVKSRFFSNVSHEFRTPLTLILGPIEKMLGDSSEPRSDDMLMLVKRNAQKLLALVSQLLDLSRIEAGTMKIKVRSGEIVSFVRRIVQSFQSWAERKNIALGYDCEVESLHGCFDHDNLEKILNNLMSNALKFTPDGGAVTVSLRVPMKSGGETHDLNATITVADTGPGIPQEHLSHIFDRFYRADESHKVEGAGIGLALVKELVEMHHGTIRVRCEEGAGTQFEVKLPLAKECYAPEEIATATADDTEVGPIVPTPPSVHPAEQPRAAAPYQAPIVLIVEDNDDVRAYIKGYLVSDYAVLEARDGQEGLEQACAAIPDLVVCDVMMPRMDGYELCRAIKQDERTSHIPVILLTARAATESKIQGLATGADDYLTKPFDADELLTRIGNLIEGRRLLREKWKKTVALKPGEVAVASLDDAFLKRVIASVETNMGRPDYGVDEMAHDACLSRSQLHRKLVALTNLSPAEFTRHMRLLRAKELLEKNAGTVAEVAEHVGFSNASHFAHAFEREFGILPHDVRGARGGPADAYNL